MIAAGASLVAVAEKTAGARDAGALGDLSLHDLMAVKVEAISVTRRGRAAKDVAAAVFVLSNADIICAGATTIPDLLRYVPRVSVGKIETITSVYRTVGRSLVGAGAPQSYCQSFDDACR